MSENTGTGIGIEKENDWFATRILNGDKDISSILESGVNPTNADLKPASYYRDKAKVKAMFTDNDGKFHEDAFMQTYNNIAEEYRYLSAVDTENYILNQYNKAESDFTTDDGKIKEEKIDTYLQKNPLHQKSGISGWDVLSDPVYSAREVAQMNRIYDVDKGE
jgi:hypothetical protein